MVWGIWLIVAVVLIVIEVFTVDFTFLMIAGGALAAAAAAGFTDELWIQILVFAIVSVILLFTVRPWAKRHITNSSPETRTNVEAHLGARVIAMTDVTERGGRVKLAGEVWTARTDGAVLLEGTTGRVVRIHGATAVVEPTINQ